MPEYSVDSEKTAATSKKTLDTVAQLQSQLAEVKTSLTNLLADGYSTPSSQGKFAPVIDQFYKDFAQITGTLEQIAQFLQTVGEEYEKTDEQVGRQVFGGGGAPQTVLDVAAQVIKQAAEQKRGA